MLIKGALSINGRGGAVVLTVEEPAGWRSLARVG